MKTPPFISLGIILMLGFTSCLSTKDVTYFQPADKSVDKIVNDVKEKYTPTIQSGDILSITVSSLSKEANEMFNPFTQPTNYNNQSAGTIAPQPVVGFTVDSAGFISLPLLGAVQVRNLTSNEVSTLLTQQLSRFLESPTVVVRIANYTISVLGEVARPAVYTVPNEQMTLTQALALAGDINIYGKKHNVLIVRERDGKREFARIDMTRRDLFDSPYYYLRPGDLVYVEPSAGKITTTDRIYQLTPIVISSLTLLVLIINTFGK